MQASRGGNWLRGSTSLLVVSLALLPACATSSLISQEGRVVHREVGFSIAVPEKGMGAWSETARTKRSLTYTAKPGRTLSLLWRCGRRPVASRIVARRLLGQLDAYEVLVGEPVETSGEEGWLQRVAVSDSGRSAHLLSVSRHQAGCDWDFVLVTRAQDPAAEAVLHEWIESFVPPKGPVS